MGYPYIGDRQLEPDEEWECTYCGHVSLSKRAHQLHLGRCPENDDIDYPDEPKGCHGQ